VALLLALGLALLPLGTWRDANAGLAISYPSSWHVTTRQLTPITDPTQRIVLYSGPAPQPRAAPKPRQVIAVLMEVRAPTDLREFPKRPRHFRLLRLGLVKSFSGKRWGELTFREHRRAFYVFIGVGSDARAQLPQLLRSLDSLQVH
jgi:hypothetical protein